MKSPTFVKQGLLVGERNRITGAFSRDYCDIASYARARVSHGESSDERTSTFMRTARSDARCAVWWTWQCAVSTHKCNHNSVNCILMYRICTYVMVSHRLRVTILVRLFQSDQRLPPWFAATQLYYPVDYLRESPGSYLALYIESSHNLEVLAMESWEGSATALLCEIISRIVWRFILSMLQPCSGGGRYFRLGGLNDECMCNQVDPGESGSIFP